MERPKCACFDGDATKADNMVQLAAVSIAEYVAPIMEATNLCRATHGVVAVTMCAMILREFAEAELTHTAGSKELTMTQFRDASDAKTHDFVQLVLRELAGRSREIGAKIREMGAEVEREKRERMN